MFDFIVYILILSIIIYLISSVIRLRTKNMSLVYDALQAYLERNIVAEKLNLALIEKENLKLEQNDDFLTFVSQSRDWAFSYIETTQDKINDFINKIGPTIEYLEKYAPPILLEEQRFSIIEGYKNIKSILPEDYGKLDT